MDLAYIFPGTSNISVRFIFRAHRALRYLTACADAARSYLSTISVKTLSFLPQIDPHRRPLVHHGAYGDPMPQAETDFPAEIKPDAAGALIPTAVFSGKSLLKNAGNILRRDANPRIGDA